MSDESEIVKVLREQENNGTLQSTSSGDSVSCVMSQQEAIHINKEEKKPGIDNDVFKKIFEFSAEAIVLINRDGVIVYANDRLCDWLGYATEEIIGKNFLNLPFLSSDDIEKTKRIFKERMLGKEIPAYELDFYTKNGKKIVGLVHAVALKNEQGVSYQNLVMISDITKKKEAEEKLQENKAKYERLFHSSPDFIAEIDEDGMFLAVNAAMAKSLGLAPENIIGKNYCDVLPKDVAETRVQFGRKALAEKTIQVCEDERAGRHFYTMFVPCETSAGKKTVQVIAKDITILKTAQKNLQENEKKYRQLVDTLNEGIWVIDQSAITTFVNPRMAQMLGYSVDEMVGKHLFSFMDEQGKTLAAENLERRQQGVKEQHDFEFIRKDGSRIYALLETGPIIDETGTYQGAIAGVQDITDRKRIEETLRYQSNLLENVSDAIIATDVQYNIQYWNKAAEKQYGWTASEVIGHPLEMFIINDYLGCSLDVILQKISQDGYWQGEVTQNRRDGVRIPILSTLSKVTNAAGQATGFIAVNRDISERKRVEDALQKSENRHRASIELTQLLAWTTTGDGEVVEDIPTWRKFTGQSYEAVKGTGWTEAIHSDDLEHTIQTWKKAVETKSVYETEYRIRRFDGVYRDFLARGIPVFKEDGSILEWTGICIDITERKKVESEINYLKKYNENILESNPNPMMVIKGKQIEYVNKSFVSIFGETKNEYIARNLKDVVPSESLPVFENLLQEDGVSKEITFRGKEFIVNSFVIKKAEEEEEEERRGILLHDITERKQAEGALKKSETLLLELTNQVPGVVYQFYAKPNGEMGFYYVSDRSERILGIKSDLEGYFERFITLVIPEHREGCIKSIEKSVKESSDWKYEGMLQKPSGEKIWFSGNSIPSPRENEMVFNGIVTDITERKQMEEALRESEERHRVLFESACDALMIIEPPSWKFSSGNPATLEMFKAKNEAEFISQGPWDVSPELQPDGRPSAEKAKEMIESAMCNGSQFFEWTHKRMNGEEFFTTVLLSRVKQGGNVFLQATVRDITKQKQLETQLKKKIDDLEQYKKVTVDRELKMIELKKEINELYKQTNQKPRYKEL